MKVKEILNEMEKREDFMIIMNKEKKYEVVDLDGNSIGRNNGYEKLEDAIDVLLRKISIKYIDANFYDKKNMVDKEMIRWKTENGIKEKPEKKIAKNGFFIIK